MSNETDLDWLARNVHEWPAGDRHACYVYWKGGHRAVSANCITAIQPCARIEKADWLARRAELQNNPSWKDAPEWAEWLAQDEDGEWKWLAGLPGKYVDGWTAVKIKGCRKGTALGDWRDTLERRPRDLSEPSVTARLEEATENVLAAVPELMTDKYKFEPFTNIEDNQEQKMQHDKGWFERGELPTVGVECTAVADGIPNANCTIVATSTDQVVVKWTENQMFDVLDMPGWSFRPIRTERDLAIDEMMKVAATNWGNLEDCCEALYRAGYRKEPK